jgi:hypothetical protein
MSSSSQLKGCKKKLSVLERIKNMLFGIADEDNQYFFQTTVAYISFCRNFAKTTNPC